MYYCKSVGLPWKNNVFFVLRFMLFVQWNWRWYGPYFIFKKQIAIKDFWIILDLIVVASTEENCYLIAGGDIAMPFDLAYFTCANEWDALTAVCQAITYAPSDLLEDEEVPNATLQSIGPGSAHMHSVTVGRFNDLKLIRIPPITLSSMIMNPLVTQFLTLLTWSQVVIAALKTSIMALKSIPQAKKQKEGFCFNTAKFRWCVWMLVGVHVHKLCHSNVLVGFGCVNRMFFWCELLYFCMIFFVCLLFQPMLFLFTNAFLPSGFRSFCPWKFLALLPPARRCGSSLRCGVLYWNHWRKIQSHWDTAQRWG